MFKNRVQIGRLGGVDGLVGNVQFTSARKVSKAEQN